MRDADNNTNRDGRSEPGGLPGCLEMEPLLAEYAEGTLAADLRNDLVGHLGSCGNCREMAEAMLLAVAAARRATPIEPPAGLLARILERTTGELPWSKRWIQRLRVSVRPMLEPRLAMGLAMALLSFSIVLRASGLDVSQMSLADLRPARLYLKLDRQAHLTGQRAVKYYRDLRIVYEIQSQLQSIRETNAPQEAPRQQPQQQQSPPRPPAQNRLLHHPVYVAALIF